MEQRQAGRWVGWVGGAGQARGERRAGKQWVRFQPVRHPNGLLLLSASAARKKAAGCRWVGCSVSGASRLRQAAMVQRSALLAFKLMLCYCMLLLLLCVVSDSAGAPGLLLH